MTSVVPFARRSYKAKPQSFMASGLRFDLAGTLDGFVDMAVTQSDGRHLTYSLTCDELRQLIAASHAVIEDIQTNCLFDRDPLLKPQR